jgi:hypothetical protein
MLHYVTNKLLRCPGEASERVLLSDYFGATGTSLQWPLFLQVAREGKNSAAASVPERCPESPQGAIDSSIGGALFRRRASAG